MEIKVNLASATFFFKSYNLSKSNRNQPNIENREVEVIDASHRRGGYAQKPAQVFC